MFPPMLPHACPESLSKKSTANRTFKKTSKMKPTIFNMNVNK